MTDEKATITTHFDLYAASWNERILIGGYRERFMIVRRMVDQLPKPQSVIDVGCGSGDYSVLFDPSVYIGLDISPAMVARCRELYPSHTFQVADGDKIDLPGGSVDLILDVAVIEYYEDALPHLEELARLLRPGGSIILVGPNGNNVTRKWASVVDRAAKTVQGRWQLKKIDPILHVARSTGQLRSLAERAGLRLAEYEYTSVYLIPEVRPIIHKLNVAISRAIGGKPFWRFVTRWSGTNLICRVVKPS